MARYSVAAAKDNLSSLIAKAEAGEEVIITRHGRATVEIRPVRAEEPDRETVLAAHGRLREVRAQIPQPSITSAEILRLEDEDLSY